MGKLNTFVHVVEVDDQGAQTGKAGTFGPDDKLPDWAVKAITNPDVWAEGEPGGESVSPPPPPASPVAAVRPPTHGAGSGRDAWAAYATGQGVNVSDDMSRDDIVAAVDARQ